jgi:phage terminase large subunit
MQITLPYQWTPRPYQQKSWDYLARGGKRSVKNWHRRSGKDEEDLQHTNCAAHERKGNYWYMMPEYAQCRKAMWDAVNPHTGLLRLDEAFPRMLRRPEGQGGTNNQEMKITLRAGSTFQLLGADNFHALVGSPPVGLVFSEYSRTDPSAWAYLMPIVEENDGWVCFNSTPYGDNHFRKLCEFAAEEPGWFYEKLTVDQTGVYSPETLAKIRRELWAIHGEDYGDALFQQEYYCSFDAAIPGSIWGDCLEQARREGRITPFLMNPELPIHTGWDLGRTDDTAIWFYQLLGREILIFDHHSSHGKDVAFYMDLLAQKLDEYHGRYGRHWLPHDARPRTLAAGGGSILQQVREAIRRRPQLGAVAIAPGLDRQEGIQAARATFPRCRFHDTRCEAGLRSLKHYHREWDETKQKFVDEPVHDWASHDADAFRILSTETPLIDRLLAGSAVKQTFGQLVKAHFAKKRRERQQGLVR